jgi:Holliday junction resolvase RusA-like endonuclease
VKAPALALREIVEAQLNSLATLALNRPLDKEEQRLLELTLKAYALMPDEHRNNAINSKVETPSKRDIDQLLKVVSEAKK